MTSPAGANRLDRPVDARPRPRTRQRRPTSRSSSTAATRARIAAPPTRKSRRCGDRFGERLRYVFRQRPITDSELARRAAELAESSADEDAFWRAHVELMSRSHSLTEDDLRAVADDVVFARVPPDERSARWHLQPHASTPTSTVPAAAASR